MRRAIVVVVDALGVGAMPDAPKFNDSPNCNTLSNVAQACGGLSLPNLEGLGLGNITEVKGVPNCKHPRASFGRMAELSIGKDTTTGHWELAGLVIKNPFDVFPNGFPKEIMDAFVQHANCGGYLGNVASSGTTIIEQFNKAHLDTGYPIVYTSADSVFQIAANIDAIPLSVLYQWCDAARHVLDDRVNVSRVIARPYRQQGSQLVRLSSKRKDLATPPHASTILDYVLDSGGHVLGIGKISDIFLGCGISHSIHTAGNTEGLQMTVASMASDFDWNDVRKQLQITHTPSKQLIFTNLVDTDSLYGHRNDAIGYGKALHEIDSYIPRMIDSIKHDDLLIITGDHGCDPTVPGTDHTREYVPVMIYNPTLIPKPLGTLESFAFVADTIADWLHIDSWPRFRPLHSSFQV